MGAGASSLMVSGGSGVRTGTSAIPSTSTVSSTGTSTTAVSRRCSRDALRMRDDDEGVGTGTGAGTGAGGGAGRGHTQTATTTTAVSGTKTSYTTPQSQCADSRAASDAVARGYHSQSTGKGPRVHRTRQRELGRPSGSAGVSRGLRERHRLTVAGTGSGQQVPRLAHEARVNTRDALLAQVSAAVSGCGVHTAAGVRR